MRQFLIVSLLILAVVVGIWTLTGIPATAVDQADVANPTLPAKMGSHAAEEQPANDSIPGDVRAAIAAKAGEDYPGNYSTQLYVIKNELSAYRTLRSLERPSDFPEEPFNELTKSAAENYPAGYSTQLYVVRNELKAWHNLQSFERPDDVPEQVFRRLKNKAASDFPTQYSTQLYVIKNELKAYRALHSLDME
jgi:hypothetical protein